jgi:hypothetical protein
MKPATLHTKYRNAVLVVVMLLSGSCLDYTVTTRVNRDGSVFRKYEVRGDSTEIFGGSLMIPSGPAWNVRHIHTYKEKGDTTSEKSQYAYISSRTFSNIGELNAWLDTDTFTMTIKTKVSLKKRFRWFYTYFDYCETYPMSFPFRNIPVGHFLDSLEQSVIMNDDRAVYSPAEHKLIWKEKAVDFHYKPSDSLEMKNISDRCEMKLQKWMVASMVKDYIDLLEANFEKEPEVNRISQNSEKLTETMNAQFRFMSNDSLSAQLLSFKADSLILSDRLEALYQSNPAIFRKFDRKISELGKLGNDDSYQHYLMLPGTIFLTDADITGREGMMWKIENMRFFMKDFRMSASSRAANPWIMVLTGMVAVMLIFILVVRRRG